MLALQSQGFCFLDRSACLIRAERRVWRGLALSSFRDASTPLVLCRYYQKYQQKSDEQPMTPLPFELEVVESALMVSTGGWRVCPSVVVGVHPGVGGGRTVAWGGYMQRSTRMGRASLIPSSRFSRPAGRLDTAMATVTRRVQQLMSRLPQDISPTNLEELRRVKGALVELEQKADTLRCVCVCVGGGAATGLAAVGGLL